MANTPRTLSKAQRAALMAAFDSGDGEFVLWCDTHPATASALNRLRLVDDFFLLTDAGKRMRVLLTPRGPEQPALH